MSDNKQNNQIDEEPMSEEEREFAEKLDQQIANAQSKLDTLGMTKDRMEWIYDKIKENKEKKPLSEEEKQQQMQEMADKQIDIPTIDRQGRKIFTLEETLYNYNNAWGPLKYRELPICWSNLKDKIKFTLPMTFMAAYTYEALSLKKIDKNLKDMKFRLLGRTWGIFFMIGTIFCTIDSIFFDDFCNIDSYHYKTLDRKKLIRELRQHLTNEQKKE